MLVLHVQRPHFEQQGPRWNYSSGRHGGKGTESREIRKQKQKNMVKNKIRGMVKGGGI